MPREYKEPKSLNEIVDEMMAKDGFDVTTGEKIGKSQKPSESPPREEPPKEDDPPKEVKSDEADRPTTDDEKPAGETPAATEPAVEDEGEALDTGKEDMPLAEREKSLRKDYHKKTTAVAQRQKELDDMQKRIEYAQTQVQRLYDYAQNMLQQAPRQGQVPPPVVAPQTPKQKFSTLPPKVKAERYAQLGINVDAFTDENVLVAIDYAIEQGDAAQEIAERTVDQKLTAHEHKRREEAEMERRVSATQNRIAEEYANLAQKYNLAPEVEFFVLEHVQEVRKYSPYYTITDGVRDYLLANRIDPDAAPAPAAPVVKAPEPPKPVHPVIPSAAVGGGSKAPTTEGQGRRVEYGKDPIEAAAAAALSDLNSNKLKHRR